MKSVRQPSFIPFSSLKWPWLGWACLQALSLLAQDLPYRFQKDVPIPMRDGTKLAASVYLPAQEGRYPVILTRSPYGKPGANFGEAKKYTAKGYAMVVQDCRGRGQSEGLWDPFRYDVQDGFDTQEWVGAQNWCNGRIGTSGGSYVGWTQWASAPRASRFLQCAVPIVPFADVHADIAYPGGAFQLSLLVGWGTSVGGVQLSPSELQSSFLHLPLASLSKQFSKPLPYLNDWISHPGYDDYWKQRGIDRQHAEIEIPMLNIGGWYDIFSKTTLEHASKVREKSKNRLARRNQFVVMGPWAHGVGVQKVGDLDFGPEAKMDLGDLQFRWFEHWLRNQDTGVEQWPAVHLFVMGENRWREEHEWPLKRTIYRPMYFQSSGKANSATGDGLLSFEAPTEQPSDEFTYDPAKPVPTTGGNNLVGAPAGPFDQSETSKRQDVLVYTSAPLSQPLEITGPIKVHLHAASTATDTDFTAKLIDVHPSGKSYNLCDGIIRARHRHGFHQEQLLAPGSVEKYEIDLWVTSNLFKPGHRLRVEISSSNFPRFDRNPNSGRRFGTDTILSTARQTIHHSPRYPSHILLPTIPR